MNTIIKKVLLLNFIFIITTSLSAQNWFSGNKKVKGNGVLLKEVREVPNYKEISIGGSFEVVLVSGKQGKIDIEAEENLMAYITTEVTDRVLKINFKKHTNINATKKMQLLVPYKGIEGVAIGGSGSVSSNHIIDTNNFNISIAGSGGLNLSLKVVNVTTSISGSGTIDLQGSAENLNCSIAGSGSVNAYDLKADKVSINIAGSGSVKTTAITKLKSKLVGSGNVYYKGKPNKIDTKSVGSGSAFNRN